MQQAGPGEQQRSASGERGGAAAAGRRTSEAVREGGYNSDSEGTGPVLKGVTHTAGHGHSHDSPGAAGTSGSGGGGPSAGSPGRHGHTHGHGDSDRSAAVVAGEAAATSHKHALQGGLNGVAGSEWAHMPSEEVAAHDDLLACCPFCS